MNAPGRAILPFAHRPFQWRPGVPRPSTARQEARTLLNELAAKFPLAGDPICAGFEQIAIPAGMNAPAGTAAWYSLVNIDPIETLGQEIVVYGFWMDALSCDVTPAGGVGAAWGDVYGLGAAIIVGVDLPVAAPGTWSYAPPPISGIDEGIVAAHTNQIGRKFRSRTFPTGSLTTNTQKRGIPSSVVPFVRRVTAGHRICAALLLNRTQANAGANKTLNGFVDIEIDYGLTQNTVDLRQ